MNALSKNDCKMQYTSWGVAVKKQMIDKGMRSNDVVDHLIEQGFNINRRSFSHLLKGLGATKRRAEIEEVSRILDIPLK